MKIIMNNYNKKIRKSNEIIEKKSTNRFNTKFFDISNFILYIVKLYLIQNNQLKLFIPWKLLKIILAIIILIILIILI